MHSAQYILLIASSKKKEGTAKGITWGDAILKTSDGEIYTSAEVFLL